MSVVLADDLADRAQFPGLAEIGSKLPDNLAVTPNDSEEAGLPAADDHVIGSEALIALVEPAVWPDKRCRVDMQPVEAAPAATAIGGRGLYRLSRIRGETELVDVVTCHPFPEDVPVPGDFDQTVVFERNVGDPGLSAFGVRQYQRLAALNCRCDAWGIVASRKVLPLPVVMLPRRPYLPASTRLDLLATIEPPNNVAREVTLNEFQRFLSWRICSVRRHHASTGKDAHRSPCRIDEVGPLLDHIAIHVNHDGRLRRKRREYGVAAPAALGVVNGDARGIHRLRGPDDNERVYENGTGCNNESQTAHRRLLSKGCELCRA